MRLAHPSAQRRRRRPPARSFWGIKPDGSGSEPDNLAGGEFCGAANYSETRQDLYAWSDSRCSAQLPYICMIRGERPLAVCVAGRRLRPRCIRCVGPGAAAD
jgi:hypothetical protein